MADMNYNFIKNIYNPVVRELNSDVSILNDFIEEKENSFILKHNIYAVSQIINFLSSSENNIFILNGFAGEGKTSVIDFILDFISEDVLIFKNEYKDAVNLDDVLLSLFKDFSIYHNDRKIILPKSETYVFSEKINAYIKYFNLPMLFIFDSFEINTKSKYSQRDMLDFINYISRYEKVKIIISSRSFKQYDLYNQDSVFSYALNAVTKEEMYDYLQQNKIEGGNFITEYLYKETRGHYLLLEYSIFIIKILHITLTNFSAEYKKSAKNYLEFVISKILTLSTDRFLKLMILLTAVRHGLSARFIIEQNFASEDDLSFLMQKHIISKKYDKYYLKDYIKNEFIKSVNTETQIRIHKYLIEVYEAELPLKPFERQLFLSRLTMRQEIAYHNKKAGTLEEELAKTGRTSLLSQNELSYMTYTHKSGYSQTENIQNQKKRSAGKLTNKSEKQKRFQLTNEDSLLLNSISSDDTTAKKFETITKQEEHEENISNDTTETDKIPNSLDEYAEIARNYENVFNFSNAVKYYKQALTYKNDENFEIKEPVIYTKIAVCYKKIQDIEQAINCYEKVYGLYFNLSSEKANDILLSIAQIYAENYKYDKAKETYNRILYSPIPPDEELKVRIYLDIAEIEDNTLNSQEAVKYVRKALMTAEKSSDFKLITECYFKYALLLDDNDNTDLAVKYYLRCVQSSDSPEENKYLASSYSNLAEIDIENGNINSAKTYYELSAEADKKINNYEGLYYSYIRLAGIYKNENSEKACDYLLKALSASKHFDDINYSVTIYIETGNWYESKGNYKKALKAYILAKNLAPPQINPDTLANIDKSINRIKLASGELEFSRLLNEIKKNI